MVGGPGGGCEVEFGKIVRHTSSHDACDIQLGQIHTSGPRWAMVQTLRAAFENGGAIAMAAARALPTAIMPPFTGNGGAFSRAGQAYGQAVSLRKEPVCVASCASIRAVSPQCSRRRARSDEGVAKATGKRDGDSSCRVGDAGLGSAQAQLPSGAAQRKGPHCDSGEADAGAAVRGMPTKPAPAPAGKQWAAECSQTMRDPAVPRSIQKPLSHTYYTLYPHTSTLHTPHTAS